MILICDDMPEIRTIISDLCTQAGYECKIANTGREAIQACRETVHTLIFMDDKLDDMLGKDAVREIRALPGPNGQAYIILLTGFPSRDDAIVTPEQDGIDLHMVKPQSIAEIERVIRAVMER